MKNQKLKFIFAIISTVFTSAIIYAQQEADPNFDAKVAHPAYPKTHPKILFDEAHNNFHTATGRYKPFADLITNDGYAITPNKSKFEKKTLEGYDVLIIANAMGAERQNMPDASKPAFTEDECKAVRDWVKAGGSLLLIADHAPFGAATENLARMFDVEMSKGFAIDENNYKTEDNNNPSFLVFSRDNKLLIDHAITRGRDESERVNRIVSFTGQSLKSSKESVAFLKLSDTAKDREPPSADAKTVQLDKLPNGQPLPPGAILRTRQSREMTSAAGRAQALAFDFGKGRVVVLGEAAMLSAQIVKGAAAQMMGRDEIKIGMNRKGNDNRQFALNIMHWLSRLLN